LYLQRWEFYDLKLCHLKEKDVTYFTVLEEKEENEI
jgi:hypothetical protein